MKGHQKHLIVIAVHGINIRYQSNFFQKTGKRRLFVFLFICNDFGNQLVNVFNSGLCFFRSLCPQFFHITGIFNNIFQKFWGREVLQLASQCLNKRDKWLYFRRSSSKRRNLVCFPQSIIETHAPLCGIILHTAKGGRANSPFWHINNSPYRQIISCIIHRL